MHGGAARCCGAEAGLLGSNKPIKGCGVLLGQPQPLGPCISSQCCIPWMLGLPPPILGRRYNLVCSLSPLPWLKPHHLTVGHCSPQVFASSDFCLQRLPQYRGIILPDCQELPFLQEGAQDPQAVPTSHSSASSPTFTSPV
jgi:hypothetical protein